MSMKYRTAEVEVRGFSSNSTGSTSKRVSLSSSQDKLKDSDVKSSDHIDTNELEALENNLNESVSGEISTMSGDSSGDTEEILDHTVEGNDMPIEDSGVKDEIIDTGIVQDSDFNSGNTGESKGISSTVVLTIVIVICTILGVVLGILAGRKSANK